MSGEINGVLSGALAMEMKLDVLSNNMANVNTVGFKEDRLFQLPWASEHLRDGIQQDSSNVAVNNISNLAVGTFTDFGQGQLKNTGNTLDFSLAGDGFFSVQTPNGVQYTRNGNFALNKDSVIVTQEGYPVLGTNNNPLKVTGQPVTVDPSGAIQAAGAQVGSFNIVDFPDKQQLVKSGGSLYSPQNTNVQGTPVPASKVKIQQGFIETSNVDSVKMMTEMIEVVRGYETYQKVLQSVNDITSRTVNDVGKIS